MRFPDRIQEDKKTHQKVNNFHVWKCSIFCFDGFSFILDVLLGGQGINVLQFLKNKKHELFQLVKLYNCLSPNPWIWIRFDLKCWIRIRMKTSVDPQLWFRIYFAFPKWSSVPYETWALTPFLILDYGARSCRVKFFIRNKRACAFSSPVIKLPHRPTIY